MDTVNHSISPAELAALVGRSSAPLLLDVRREEAFRHSDKLLGAARWCAPEHVEAFAQSEPRRDLVVYCVFGHAVSQGAAQALRDAGWNARFLLGGLESGEDGVDPPDAIAQWRSTPLPMLRKREDLGVTGERPSRWVTRERPKIDRIACPWLVLRFIDPRAEFFYLPTSRVFEEARRTGAVAYDIPGAPISHQGELCSFDTLLAAFGLQDPALQELARVVRGADTDRLDLAPQSAGLLAVSLGLSALHGDDHAMLAAALPLYDALYAWCRGAKQEAHSWNPPPVAGAPQ